MVSEKEIWRITYEKIALLLEFGDFSMNLWFGGTELKKLTDTTAYIQIGEDYQKNIVDLKYLDVVKEAFKGVLGFEVTPIFISVQKRTFEDQFADILCEKDPSTESEQPANYTIREDGFKVFGGELFSKTNGQSIEQENPSRQTEEHPYGIFYESPKEPTDNEKRGVLLVSRSSPNYSPEYNFENFVVGNSNKFAHAACVAVAKHPATQFNPLFIYGSPGLGKTHLLYAITREISLERPSFNIVYVKGEDFTNELIEAMRNNATAKFREKYRNSDVLLVDDIQFIGGKVSTEEEFFHTFNSLYESNKQIIMTSDRPPKDISTLEERLRSRFEWGLLADIQPPDLELRIAIFKKKALAMNIVVPNDVLLFLGENIKENIRQIEGVIKKLRALSFLKGEQITINLARKVVSDILSAPETPSITFDKVVKCVSKRYAIPEEDILGKKRSQEIVRPRHISIYLIRRLTDMSLPAIAKVYNRDHTTIMASIENVEKDLKSSPDLAYRIEEMIKELKNPVQ